MKLRLLFTIIIPALCGALGMEMRGMETAAAFIATATGYAAKATSAVDEFKNLTQKETDFLTNLRDNTIDSNFKNIFHTLYKEVRLKEEPGEGPRKTAFKHLCYVPKDGKSVLAENLYDLVYSNSFMEEKDWLLEPNVNKVSLALITYALSMHSPEVSIPSTQGALENFASNKCTLVILQKPLTPLIVAAYEKIVALCKDQIQTGTTDTTMLTGTKHPLVQLIRGLIIPAGQHMDEKTPYFYAALNKALAATCDIDGLIDAMIKRYAFAQSLRSKQNAVNYYLENIKNIIDSDSHITVPQNWLSIIPNEKVANEIIAQKYDALSEGSVAGEFDKKFIREAFELLEKRSPKEPIKKLVPPFIEHALSTYCMSDWLSKSQELEPELEKWLKLENKFDGSTFINAIKTLHEISDKNLSKNEALTKKAQTVARFLAMHCDELFEKNHGKRLAGEDQENAGFIAQVFTEVDWNQSYPAQTMLFDLIGLQGCIYYTQANATSDDTQKLTFIKQFLTLKHEEQAVAELFKVEATGKRLLAICTSQAMKKGSAVKKVEIPVAPKKSAENPKDEVVISGEKPAPVIWQTVEKIIVLGGKAKTKTHSNLGNIGTPVLKITAEEPKVVPVAIPEREQATLNKRIYASYPTQHKSSLWKPVVATTVVAGLGAACWYQWNTVKAFAQQYVPESVAQIFARFQKASA